MMVANLRCLVVAALVLAGCEKASDVNALQDEANGVVASYRARLDALAQRHRALVERILRTPGARATSDADQITRLANDTRQHLVEMSGIVNSAPAQITSRANAKDSARSELMMMLVSLERQLGEGTLSINRDLNTIESWLGYIDVRPQRVAAAPSDEAPPGAPRTP